MPFSRNDSTGRYFKRILHDRNHHFFLVIQKMNAFHENTESLPVGQDLLVSYRPVLISRIRPESYLNEVTNRAIFRHVSFSREIPAMKIDYFPPAPTNLTISRAMPL